MKRIGESEMENEIWVPVNGYDGLYEVSNMGRVASLPTFYKQRKILKPWKIKGYEYVGLTKNKQVKRRRVHVIVMESFTDYKSVNGSNITIDHIDGNRSNNKLENLEVTTMKENIRRAVKRGSYKGHDNVPVIDLDTKEIYPSYTSAGKSCGSINGTCVRKVCLGEMSHYKGRRFAKLEDYKNNTIPMYVKKTK